MLSGSPTKEFLTECIICTMSKPTEKRRYLKNTEEFVKHNIEHILENRTVKIKPQDKPQREDSQTPDTDVPNEYGSLCHL